jgi:hypothetical protein
MGSGGELILGLQGPSVTEKTVVPFKGGYSGGGSSSDCTSPRIPGVILVVKDDLAYEYTFQGPSYRGVNVTGIAKGASVTFMLQHAGYRLTAMKNRHGDAIRIDYSPDQYGDYTAKWLVDGQDTGVSVAMTGCQVTYGGMDPAPAYSFSALGGMTMPSAVADALDACDPDGLLSFPTSVKDDRSGEEIRISYGSTLVGGIQDPFGTFTYANAWVPGTIAYPGRTVTLGWSAYGYEHTDGRGFADNAEAVPEYTNLTGNSMFPAWAGAVASIRHHAPSAHHVA